MIDGAELARIVEESTGVPQLVPGTDAERRPGPAAEPPATGVAEA